MRNNIKTAKDVILNGYNCITQNGVDFKIVGGKGDILFIQEEGDINKEVLSISVNDVEKFYYCRTA